MSAILIYGKIIIDDIQLADGRIARNILGGGGPQAAFGARLWHDSVGLLSRAGTDLEAGHVQTLQDLDIDLSGWQQYPDIPTPRNRLMTYDPQGHLELGQGSPLVLAPDRAAWDRLLAQPLTLPPAYQQARAIHLITEFYAEPMIETALALQANGAIFSLEPFLDFVHWSNRDGMLALFAQADVVTPDWPSASGIAGSDDPRRVMQFWQRLGSRLIAIRHGHYGSYVWERQQDQIWHIPALPVQVVDPTGAGNGYGGGLCAGWTLTSNARLAGCYGAVAAKFLVERVGLPVMSPSLQAEAQRLLEEAVLGCRLL
jgi:sugar/nucleoside kinase (ribokinase family)